MYQHFAKYYDQIFPFKEETKIQLKRWIKKDGKAVDLGCATGHLVGYLNQQDMQASGVDIDEAMIDMAKKNYPSLPFVLSDMVKYLHQQKEMDLLTCLGNTLPHLDLQPLKSFIHHAYHALSKKGVMIIQLLNYDKIMNELPSHLPDIITPDLSFQRNYMYHHNHIVFETKIHINNQTTSGSTMLYPYKKEELKILFENQGFHAECYQNMDLEPWTLSSSYQTWILTRK